MAGRRRRRIASSRGFLPKTVSGRDYLYGRGNGRNDHGMRRDFSVGFCYFAEKRPAMWNYGL